MDWGSNNFGAPGRTGNRMSFQGGNQGGFGTSGFRPSRQYMPPSRQPRQPQPSYPPQQGYSRPQQQQNFQNMQNSYQGQYPAQPPPQPMAGSLYNQGRALAGAVSDIRMPPSPPPSGNEELIANPYRRPGEMHAAVLKPRSHWDRQEQERQQVLRENQNMQFPVNPYQNYGDAWPERPSHRIAPFEGERRRF